MQKLFDAPGKNLFLEQVIRVCLYMSLAYHDQHPIAYSYMNRRCFGHTPGPRQSPPVLPLLDPELATNLSNLPTFECCPLLDSACSADSRDRGRRAMFGMDSSFTCSLSLKNRLILMLSVSLTYQSFDPEDCIELERLDKDLTECPQMYSRICMGGNPRKLLLLTFAQCYIVKII